MTMRFDRFIHEAKLAKISGPILLIQKSVTAVGVMDYALHVPLYELTKAASRYKG